MTRARRLVGIATAALAVDLALIVVTGGGSLVDLAGSRVGPWGLASRAAGLGIGLWLVGRVLVAPERRWNGGRLVLLLLLLPTLVQFQFDGGRLSGVDAISYYVFLRSLAKDGDFDLTNEYAHYGMLERPDLSMPTQTGHRRSIYSVGPAVLWAPFFAVGEAVARMESVLRGPPSDLSGYGPHHRNAVALGSVLYGWLALLLIHGVLRRHFGEATSLGATLLVWATTFFHWYLVIQPLYSHNASTAAAALGLWLWDRDQGRRDAGGYLLLGLVLGLGMCVRWQNGVLLALPGIDLLAGVWRAPRSVATAAGFGGLLVGGAAIGAFPQMAAWKAIYDIWVLPYPPQGTDFLRFDHPWVLETLFSSRHGLLSWTPSLWAGYLGFLPLLRRRPGVGWPLVAPLLAMSYVNFCVGDWWAGGSFSNRRFDSLLPIFAFGLAASLDLAWRFLRGNAGPGLALLLAPVLTWNLLLTEQVRRGMVPRDDTVAFPQLARGAAELVSRAVGFPTTWPASWLFAWRHDLPPSQYDRLVGRYLFYRQNSLGGRIELAAAAHAELLDDGWGRPESHAGVAGRRARGDARLFAPLDVPEDIEVVVIAAAPAGERPVSLQVNGRDVGRFLVRAAWDDHHVRVPAGFWRREINELRLAGAGGVLVSDVRFVRLRLVR
jgi:hypothetical protein